MSELIKQETKVIGVFDSMANFEDAQRIANMLSKSDLVPVAYKNNIPNTMIALEMSNRIGISPFMVMQNLDIIQGKPSWRSSFIIAALNTSGRFKNIRFIFEGNDKNSNEYGCRCVAENTNGDSLIGPIVDWKMVKAEGWLEKKGSKWQTMPELMFQYRAAAFFGRLYAPDVLNGMYSNEEIKDSGTIDQEFEDVTLEIELKELFEMKKEKIFPEDMPHIERIIDNKEKTSYQKAINILKQL